MRDAASSQDTEASDDLVEVMETREDAIAGAISMTTLDVMTSGEVCTIAICTEICAVPYGYRNGSCDLCERIACFPDGRVDRERLN